MDETTEPEWVAEWVRRFLREPTAILPVCPECQYALSECRCPREGVKAPMAEHSFSGILDGVCFHCPHRAGPCKCDVRPAPSPPEDPRSKAHREQQGQGHYRGAPWQEPVKARWWPRLLTWLIGTPS